MMTPDEYLQRLTELERAATPGNWVVRVNKWKQVDGIVAPNPDPGDDCAPPDVVIVETDSGHYPPRPADAMLIAVARNVLPYLLAVARAAGEVVRAEQERISEVDRAAAHQALVMAWKGLGR